jgi:voltage-gated sodium channel
MAAAIAGAKRGMSQTPSIHTTSTDRYKAPSGEKIPQGDEVVVVHPNVPGNSPPPEPKKDSWDLGNERGGSFASEPAPPAEPKLGKSDRGMTDERRASTGAEKAPMKLDGGVFQVGGGESAMEDIAKPAYDVTDFYRERGIMVRVCTHPIFENTTFAVIGLNALWLGFDSDNNDADTVDRAPFWAQLGESFFAIYFTFEVMVRFFSFKYKRNCLKDGWFKFDSALVTLMILETWCFPIMFAGQALPFDASVLRLLRLLRLARMVRLLRGLPELLTLVKAMGSALRSVSTVMVLLMLLIYVFAIVFRMMLGSDAQMQHLFGGMPLAMANLFYIGTLGDNIGLVFLEIGGVNPACGFLFLLYIFLTMFTVLNMLIGVLCEVVAAISEQSKEEILVDYVKETLLKVLQEFDDEGDGLVSRREFDALMVNEDAREAFIRLDVNPDNFKTVSEFLFEPDEPGGPEKELTFAVFLKRVMQMRSSNQARVLDVMELNKMVARSQRQVEAKIAEMETKVDPDIQREVEAKLAQMQARLEEEQKKRADEIDETKRRIEAKLDEKFKRLEEIVEKRLLG